MHWLRLIHLELFSLEIVPIAATIRLLLRGLHHVYFKPDDYLHCVVPNKCFENMRMIHFYGDYHHSLLKATHMW